MGDGNTYHHGNLRQELLRAARETIRTKGWAHLTLRGVAKAANVSHAAPYHHFKDKSALLASVAEEGFRELAVSVESRSAQVTRPAAALQEAALAYVVFAVENPDLFRVMFGPQLADKTAHPSLQDAAAAAYRSLEVGLSRCNAARDIATDNSSRDAGIASWSAIHGLAILLIDNQIANPSTMDIDNLVRGVTDVFWVGLSNIGAE